MSWPEEKHYLKIHFAPSTSCVAVQITEGAANEIISALGKHGNGEVTIEVSRHVKASLRLGAPKP